VSRLTAGGHLIVEFGVGQEDGIGGRGPLAAASAQWIRLDPQGIPRTASAHQGVLTPAPGRCEMAGCLFCQIIARETRVVQAIEDDRLVAINDINPQAPLHVLVIPRRHIPTLNDLAAEDASSSGTW
jgi:hypothetical protein